MTDAEGSLAGTLLIAMPNLADPNFHRSVVLIGVHSPSEGAFGLVVNRPVGMELAAVLSEIGQEVPAWDLPEVLLGGPVETGQGFVVFADDDGLTDDDALHMNAGVSVSGSSEVLAHLVSDEQARPFYLVLGYAGWHAGQLEQEIEENAWLVAPLDRRIVFDVPVEDRWNAALQTLGVDPGTLVDTSGTSAPS